MFNKMVDADAETSDSVICTVPDDVPSEPCMNQKYCLSLTASDLQHLKIFQLCLKVHLKEPFSLKRGVSANYKKNQYNKIWHHFGMRCIAAVLMENIKWHLKILCASF